jgi:hypothetical protein
MMHEPEKSDFAIVATKPANKAGRPVTEQVERWVRRVRCWPVFPLSHAVQRQAATIRGRSLNTLGRSRMP